MRSECCQKYLLEILIFPQSMKLKFKYYKFGMRVCNLLTRIHFWKNLYDQADKTLCQEVCK